VTASAEVFITLSFI